MKKLSSTFLSILALLSETLVFGFLGLALFTFEAEFDIVYCFAGTVISVSFWSDCKGYYSDSSSFEHLSPQLHSK